jgi:hypothetical protein
MTGGGNIFAPIVPYYEPVLLLVFTEPLFLSCSLLCPSSSNQISSTLHQETIDLLPNLFSNPPSPFQRPDVNQCLHISLSSLSPFFSSSSFSSSFHPHTSSQPLPPLATLAKLNPPVQQVAGKQHPTQKTTKPLKNMPALRIALTQRTIAVAVLVVKLSNVVTLV